MTTIEPFNPTALLWIALLNPAVPLVGLLMGRAADQWQKLVVVAFVAALAGSLLLWVAAWVRIVPARGLGGEAGLFMLHFALGLAWGAAGYGLLRPGSDRGPPGPGGRG